MLLLGSSVRRVLNSSEDCLLHLVHVHMYILSRCHMCLTDLLTSSLYSLLRTFTSLTTDASLSYYLPFVSLSSILAPLKSSSPSSSHLSLCHSTFLLPASLASWIILVTLLWFIIITCPNHSNLLLPVFLCNPVQEA